MVIHVVCDQVIYFMMDLQEIIGNSEMMMVSMCVYVCVCMHACVGMCVCSVCILVVLVLTHN